MGLREPIDAFCFPAPFNENMAGEMWSGGARVCWLLYLHERLIQLDLSDRYLCMVQSCLCVARPRNPPFFVTRFSQCLNNGLCKFTIRIVVFSAPHFSLPPYCGAQRRRHERYDGSSDGVRLIDEALLNICHGCRYAAGLGAPACCDLRQTASHNRPSEPRTTVLPLTINDRFFNANCIQTQFLKFSFEITTIYG